MIVEKTQTKHIHPKLDIQFCFDKAFISSYSVLMSVHSQVSGKNERTLLTSARFAGFLFNFLPRRMELKLENL